MAGFKISTFLGIAPKISPELLPAAGAQIAHNCKLYSGDLIPYPQPVVAADSGRIGVTKTIYALRNPSTNDPVWLAWATDVDVAIASSTADNEQRFYYTGSGSPKVSNYDDAAAGLPPYPGLNYDLGLPLPDTVLTTVAASFTTKTTASFARDAGNNATIVTSAAHGLRTGNTVTISGFTHLSGTYNQPGTAIITVTINSHGLNNGAQVTLNFTTGTATDSVFTISNVTVNTFDVTAQTVATTNGDVELDLRSFNATGIEVTKIDNTTFTYFSPGFQIATTAYTSGEVQLGGLTQARSYVYTWMSGWEEESIASKPSDNLYIKEGQTVTVSNIPTTAPVGNNFVRGVRLYRTLASASGTEYFRLSVLWFPVSLDSYTRTSNVVTVTNFIYPHMLSEGDRFKLSGASPSSFNITGGIVTEVIDRYKFRYAQVGINEGGISGGGTLYHDVSETTPTGIARYWGDGTYNFTDDFDSTGLSDILDTSDYAPPPDDLQGLVAIQNSVLVGFIGNQIFFSEPGQPHAWPEIYTITLEHNIVALVPYGGALMVLTDSYPYLVQGSDPANMSVQRIDAQYPCISRRSVVTMDYGVVYSTYDGLVVISQASGPQIVTKVLFQNDTWQTELDPKTIIAVYYGSGYLASHSTGGFVFERDEQIGGYFTTVDYSATASFYDTIAGRLYYASGTQGDIYEWDNLAQPPLTMEWKSKVFITKEMINLGAARIIADYGTTTILVWDTTTSTWETTSAPWNVVTPVSFRLWANKNLVLTTDVVNTKTFRLPTGFRTDTYEVAVTSTVRVRALHLGLTPLGLREV